MIFTIKLLIDAIRGAKYKSQCCECNSGYDHGSVIDADLFISALEASLSKGTEEKKRHTAPFVDCSKHMPYCPECWPDKCPHCDELT